MADHTRTEIKARLLPIMYSRDGDLYSAVQSLMAQAWEEGYEAVDPANPYATKDTDPWGHGRNPLGCCGDRRMHGGPGCVWPGTTKEG